MKSITTTAEAERAIDDLTALIGKLAGLVQQETALIHAGHIRRAAALEPAKAELAGELFAANERLKASAKFVRQSAPARCRTARPARSPPHLRRHPRHPVLPAQEIRRHRHPRRHFGDQQFRDAATPE